MRITAEPTYVIWYMPRMSQNHAALFIQQLSLSSERVCVQAARQLMRKHLVVNEIWTFVNPGAAASSALNLHAWHSDCKRYRLVNTRTQQ